MLLNTGAGCEAAYRLTPAPLCGAKRGLQKNKKQNLLYAWVERVPGRSNGRVCQ
jgi:hypothetical protein